MFFEGNNPSRQEVHENSLQQNQIRKKHENERKSLFIKRKEKIESAIHVCKVSKKLALNLSKKYVPHSKPTVLLQPQAPHQRQQSNLPYGTQSTSQKMESGGS